MANRFTAFFLAVLLAGVPASAEEKKASPESEQGRLDPLKSILPLGKTQRGITYPLYDGSTGKVSTILLPQEMVRRDDENLDIKDMVIELYRENGEIDYTIRLLTALYHMPTEQLSSNDRTRIEGRTFTLEGDTMVYDTKEKICRMTGDIRMVISNPSTIIKKPEPQPEPKEK